MILTESAERKLEELLEGIFSGDNFSKGGKLNQLATRMGLPTERNKVAASVKKVRKDMPDLGPADTRMYGNKHNKVRSWQKKMLKSGVTGDIRKSNTRYKIDKKLEG